MAPKTPRLLWQNAVHLTAARVTASSQQDAFPVAWLKDPSLALRWRSRIGWTVVDAFNDRLDFSSGVLRTAQLTPGTYASATDLAAHVQQALMAAGLSGASVSYASGRFTLAASGAFSLPWVTGPNTNRSFGRDMGFTVTADRPAATSHVAQQTSYQSRAFVDIDLGAATYVRAIALRGFGVSTDALLRCLGNDTPVWTAPPVNRLLAGDSKLKIDFADCGVRRYFRLLIDDVTSATGFCELGILYLGSYWQPGRSFRQGYRETDDTLGGVVFSMGGTPFSDERGTRLSFEGELCRLSRADRDTWAQIVRYVGHGRPFFLATDPQNQAITDTYYGLLQGPLTRTQGVGDGNPPDRFDVSFGFIEVPE
jgi:hypothetical protein